MDEAKASQTEYPYPLPGELWDRNSLLVSHDDVFDGTTPADENAYLASNFV